MCIDKCSWVANALQLNEHHQLNSRPMHHTDISIRPAEKRDCRCIAELALMAGEGIPAYFWEQARRLGQDIMDVGAEKAASDATNFSWRNAQIALSGGRVAGMLLAYRLADTPDPQELQDCPAFLRPLIELEQCVPGSFYVNMLATYAEFRGMGVGTALMGLIDPLARESGCNLSSIEVFEQNLTALRLYRRLGYAEAARRPVVPHESHGMTGDVVLLTRPVRRS